MSDKRGVNIPSVRISEWVYELWMARTKAEVRSCLENLIIPEIKAGVVASQIGDDLKEHLLTELKAKP